VISNSYSKNDTKLIFLRASNSIYIRIEINESDGRKNTMKLNYLRVVNLSTAEVILRDFELFSSIPKVSRPPNKRIKQEGGQNYSRLGKFYLLI
jgi:hypothetical protein